MEEKAKDIENSYIQGVSKSMQPINKVMKQAQ